ncbi:Gfo/Idh/MocA family protein [Chromobacterium vaccinii]|uniref:Gfo/Idh/MocA family protein n=1 Tax=Chromobacterium vaccinii TaxID=1108595 RepID=UPI000617ABF3|nr:Gfo/Idh/MocA family oxidoreductase [Chromobacterium vaccinii]
MKAVVIGLGSMGKRRVRCLQALGVMDIVGVDLRADRRDEVAQRYGIRVEAELDQLWTSFAPDVAIISLPPKAHVAAMHACLARRVPFFVEASVVDDGLAAVVALAKQTGVVAAPSTTLHFHPAIAEISRIVRSGRLGKISNVMLHSGQYLPDWHSYEPVSDYYVSDPATGGAREIVPFEMTWFTELFGFPRRVAGQYRKTIDIAGAEYIDDTYNGLFDYGTFLATITVDVVSRHATRRLTINGDKALLAWSWDEAAIKVFDGATAQWTEFGYQMEQAEPGYNKNIGENMYIDEIRAFLDAVAGKAAFPNSLEQDHRVLKLLYALERSDATATFQAI